MRPAVRVPPARVVAATAGVAGVATVATVVTVVTALAAASAAHAGDTAPRLVAAQGTRVAGEAGGTTVDPGSQVLLDASGRVLFEASFLVDASGSGVRGKSWMRADGSGVRRVVSGLLNGVAAGDPAPDPAGIATAGETVRTIDRVWFSRTGRAAFDVSLDRPAGGTIPGFIAETSAGRLRLVAAAGLPAPGLACALTTIGTSGESDSKWFHDGFLVTSGGYGSQFDPVPCDPSIAGRRGIFVRSPGADFVQAALEGAELGTTGEMLLVQFSAPRALGDGTSLFLTRTRKQTDDRTGLAVFDPSRPSGQEFTLLAQAGLAPPGLADEATEIGAHTIAAPATAGGQPRLLYAVRTLSDGSWAVYDHDLGATAAPVVRTGRDGGASDLVAGLLGASSRIAVLPYAGGRVIVGEAEGASVSGADPIGVFRHDAAHGLDLVVAPGMTFTDGSTFTIEAIYSVMTNGDGDVAAEVTYRDGTTRSALLVSDIGSPGTLRCALRAGDAAPTIGGAGTVSSVGQVGTPSFPAVFGPGQDGGPCRFNERGEIVVRLLTRLGQAVPVPGVYVVGGPGGPPGPGAGNLEVKARNGVVRVSGTKGADGVRIDLLGGGRVSISGTGGTTVDGGSAPVEADASRRLTVDTGDGDDTVEIAGTACPPSAAKDEGDCPVAAGAIALLLGVGSDTATIGGVQAASLVVSAGDERPGGEATDEVTVNDSAFDGRAYLFGGRWGELEFGCADSEAGSLALRASRNTRRAETTCTDTTVRGPVRLDVRGAALSHADLVRLLALADGGRRTTVRVDGGNGDDTVEVSGGSRPGTSFVARLGNGANTFSWSDSETAKLDVRGGRDEDDVTCRRAVEQGFGVSNVRADLKGGNDRMSLLGLDPVEFRWDMGAGDDACSLGDLPLGGDHRWRGRLGSGNDTVTVRFQDIGAAKLAQGYLALVIDGGPGADTLQTNIPSLYGLDPPEFEGFHSVIDDVDGIVQLAKR